MTQLAQAPAVAPTIPATGMVVDPVTRVAGSISLNVKADGGRFRDARCGVGNFRGYENILLGRDWRDAIFLSSRSCGYHGGQHSVASAQALEMAVGLTPPPIAVGIRNMGLCAEMIHAEAAHLVLLVGPDFCAEAVKQRWPDLWASARKAPAPQAEMHGYRTIGDIMASFDPLSGRFYKDAFGIARIPYQMFALVGGKYPHPETIVPGGVATSVSHTTVSKFHDYVVRLLSLVDPAKGVVAMVDDLFDYVLEQVPEIAEIGVRPANLIDSGMWDNPEGYDATWEGLSGRGDRRWASPGVILDGKLVTTDLRQVVEGIEESIDRSFYDSWSGASHPFDKRTEPHRSARSWDSRYSWSTSARWRGNVMETGPGARLWATAMRGKMPYNPFLATEEGGLQLNLPEGALPQLLLDWRPPKVWNAIERNRARLYGIIFAALVAANEALNALDLQKQDDVAASAPMNKLKPRGELRGVGLAGDGMLGHWLTLHDGTIANYQIVSPSTFNAGPGGPIEEAVNGTPLLQGIDPGIEALMAVRSFDPCGNCAAT